MWLRFLGISFLNLVAQVIATIVLLRFILPAQTPLFALSLSVWVLAFLLSLLFASWAFAKRLPTRRDALLLLLIHLLLALSIFLAYGIFLSDRGPWVVVSPEIIIQLILEGCAILIAAFRIRRKKIQSALGEGMVV